MAVGIDLNYFFSWPLVYYLFLLLLPRPQGLKTQRQHGFLLTKRGTLPASATYRTMT